VVVYLAEKYPFLRENSYGKATNVLVYPTSSKFGFL